MARTLGFRQVLALLLILLFYTLMMSLKGFIQDLDSTDTRWILVAIVTAALLSIVIILCYYKSHYERYRSTTSSTKSKLDKVEHLLEEFALPIGIIVFGGGAIILRLFYLLADFQCLGFYSAATIYSSFIKEHIGNWWPLQDGHYVARERYKESVSRIIMNMTVLVFFCIQLIFLNMLHSLKYIRVQYFFHNCIILIAGADVAVWLWIFFKESHIIHVDDIPYGETPLEVTKTLKEACMNYSSAIDVYLTSSMEHNLFPFTMEFMIVSLEVLLHVWLLPRKTLVDPAATVVQVNPYGEQSHNTAAELHEHAVIQQHGQPPTTVQPPDPPPAAGGGGGSDGADVDVEPGQGNDETDALIEGHLENSLYIVNAVRGEFSFHEGNAFNVVTNCCHKAYCLVIKLTCNLYTALFFSMIEMVLIKYYILNYRAMKPEEHFDFKLNHKDYDYMSATKFDKTVNVPVVLFRLVCSLIPALMASVHCAWILSTSSKIRPGESRLNGSYVVLALAIGGEVLLGGFELVVCFIKMKNSHLDHIGYLLGMLEAILYVFQYIAQALLIYFGQRRRPCRSHRFYETLQGRLTYLAMFNFTHWGIDSFLEIEFLSLRNDLRTGHGDGSDDVWKVFVNLFIPPCIYFRYISCLLILRVKRLIRETDQADMVQNDRTGTDYPRPETPGTLSLSTHYGTLQRENSS